MGKAARFLLLLAGRIKPLLDQFSGAEAAYSLRSLSASTTNVVKVRRDSDDAELDFTASDISNGTLTSWVNTDVQVMTNPDITSATGWTIAANTTYNASTEAFDLVNENGNTVRQSKAIAGLTYDITLVVDSFSSGSMKVYVGGAQSATISSAGTYNFTITAGSLNSFLGINPSSATCSISSYYATQTISNGFVTTWYDQSGNTNNATQATAASQPKIVSSGSLVTENGKAAIDFDGSNDQFSIGDISLYSNTNGQSIFSVFNSGTSSGNIIGKYSTSSLREYRLYYNTTSNTIVYGVQSNPSSYDGNQDAATSASPNSQYLATAVWNPSVSTSVAVNGGVFSSAVSPASSMTDTARSTLIGEYNDSDYINGLIQEIIIYNSDQSAKRTGIEANINDYYNIYP